MTKLIDLTGRFPEKSEDNLEKIIGNLTDRLEIDDNYFLPDFIVDIKKLFVNNPESKKKKPIEFVKYIKSNGELEDSKSDPKDFYEIKLISRKDSENEFDLFESRISRNVYRHLGHANDFVI